MKKREEELDETSEGLNQIMEIINAKGDVGELREIVGRGREEDDKRLK